MVEGTTWTEVKELLIRKIRSSESEMEFFIIICGIVRGHVDSLEKRELDSMKSDAK